ncbi:unnamed protein product [Allacma fusca]|uniref:DNA repair protein REV1 n=1 Tax=Allacma fusca TaxID=39272 RepID=A0A8J2KSQ8_9HEXA|nr:unnamed protein product [Allacma fusca]
MIVVYRDEEALCDTFGSIQPRNLYSCMIHVTSKYIRNYLSIEPQFVVTDWIVFLVDTMSKREVHGENGFEEFGGYMAAKRAKLNNQFNESGDNGCDSSIFSGVTININGHVNPTNLRAVFLQHGGRYEAFPTSSTDFVIAANLSEATKRKWGTKTLRPEWVVDSIAAGEKLDSNKYFLYDFNEENKQKTLRQAFSLENNAGGSSAAAARFTTSPKRNNTEQEQMSDSPKKGKRLMAWEDGFLEEFWDHSRLHNISTMKRTLQHHICKLRRSKNTHNFTELKNYEVELRLENCSQNQDVSYRSGDAMLFLVDLDCFFVSVGRINRPHVNNVPVVVTHFSGNKTISSNSDIACASYEARKFGVKNGMWVSQARELCPSLEVIPYDFEAYQRVSMQFCNIVAAMTLDIEPGSCDELLVDVTSVINNLPGSSPLSLAQFLRKRIFEETQCKASVGIVLKTQPIGDLPGIGYSLKEKLETQFSNIRTCEDLQQLKLEDLKSRFGAKKGDILFNSCRGIDDSSLQFDFERPKSISIDVNYGIRLTEQSQLEKLLLNIAKALSKRALEAEACGTKLQVTLLTQQKGAPEPKKSGGHGYVDVHNKSGQLINPTRNHLIFYKSILSLIRSVTAIPVSMYRGIGVHLTGLKFDFDGKKDGLQTLMSSLFKQGDKPTSKADQFNCVSEPVVATVEAPKTIKLNSVAKEDVDLNVLSALPDDIAMEVATFYGLDKLKEYCAANPEMPTTSRAAILDQKFKYPKVKITTEVLPASPTLVPNLSESFLGALPDDIREELESDIEEVKQIKSAVHPSANNAITCRLPQHKNKPNPAKLISAVVTQANISVNDAPEEEETEILRVVSVAADETPESTPFNRINWWRYNSKDAIPSEQNSTNFTVVTRRVALKSFVVPSLNEQSEMPDIRRIIREGVEFLPNPSREDLNGLIDYLDELISGPFMKQTQVLLKFLNRLANLPSTSQKWAKIFKLMIRICQSKIQRIFGFPMELHDIEDDFVEPIEVDVKE